MLDLFNVRSGSGFYCLLAHVSGQNIIPVPIRKSNFTPVQHKRWKIENEREKVIGKCPFDQVRASTDTGCSVPHNNPITVKS